MVNRPGSAFKSLFRLSWLPYVVLLLEIGWFVWFFMTEKDPTTGRPLRLILMDDAMISMDYARSLVQGCGLVWYCGADKVEGFTNPLWVLYMAFWHLFPIPPTLMSLPIVLTGIGTVFIQLYYARKIAERHFSNAVVGLSQWLLVLLPPVWMWHIGGLETGALMALTTFLIYRTTQMQGIDGICLFLMAIGLLIRMDFLVIVGALTGYWSWHHRNLNILLRVGVVAGAMLGGLILLRWWYYEDIVPNTYRLKVSSIPIFLRAANGLLSQLGSMLIINLPFWFLVSLGFFRRKGTEPLRAVWLWLFLALNAYAIYTGGDAWETQALSNRYLAPLYPCAAIWAATMLSNFKPILRGAGILLVANGFSTRLPYFLLLHPHAHSLSKIAPNNHYSVFVPFDVEALRLSREGSIWLGPAGTTPYFYPGYRYRDYFGKCDTSVSRSSPTCYAPARVYHIYAPGHTRVGIDKVLQDTSSQIVFIGKRARIGRNYTFSCAAESYLPEFQRRFVYDERGFWLRRPMNLPK